MSVLLRRYDRQRTAFGKTSPTGVDGYGKRAREDAARIYGDMPALEEKLQKARRSLSHNCLELAWHGSIDHFYRAIGLLGILRQIDRITVAGPRLLEYRS